MRHLYIKELLEAVDLPLASPDKDLNTEAEFVFEEWKNQLIFDGIDFLPSLLDMLKTEERTFLSLLGCYFNTSDIHISQKRTLKLSSNNTLFSSIGIEVNPRLNIFTEILIDGHNLVYSFLESANFENLSKKEITVLHDSLFESLYARLLTICDETLNLEYKVFCENEAIDSKNPDLIKNYHINHLSDKDYRTYLFKEYPVLFRLAVEEVANFIKNFKEFLKRLDCDYKDVLKINNHKRSCIVGLTSNVGDPRIDGCLIHIIRFDKGCEVVYKPWNLKMQESFNTLITQVSASLKRTFYTAKTITKEDYGWMECIEQVDNPNQLDLSKNCSQTGNLLAILYILDAIDFHSGNIIYSKNGPVVIDCETLFQPDRFTENPIHNSTVYNDYNVLEVALLPKIIKSVSSQAVLDEGSSISNYSDLVNVGFEECYMYFLNHKVILSSLILELFKECPIRIVLRSNKVYNHLMTERLKPEVLTDGYKSDMLFDWLWGYIPKFKHLKRLVIFEKECLLKREIPVFYTFFSSYDLFFGGEKVSQKYFYDNAKERLLSRLKEINTNDLKTQQELISGEFLKSN